MLEPGREVFALFKRVFFDIFFLEGLGSQLKFPFRRVEPMQETCLN